MKIKMLETFQGTNSSALLVEENIRVSIFAKDDVLEVDAALGAWLIENNKAVEIMPKQYGAKIVKEDKDLRALRHDDEVKEEPAPAKEIGETQKESKPQKRTRK